jgi:hypothetical protein
MAKEILILIEDEDEGGYVARALGYSIFSEADMPACRSRRECSCMRLP